ncbi:FAD-dependent oxidoreductase [Achromobacter xylosoxidans]
MMELPTYPFVRPDELDRARPAPHPVIVVGGGLSGLTMALDLVRRGQRVTLLDDDNTVGVRGLASRGMVWAQRTLDIFDRLDVADAIVAKGCAGTSGACCAAMRQSPRSRCRRSPTCATTAS